MNEVEGARLLRAWSARVCAQAGEPNEADHLGSLMAGVIEAQAATIASQAATIKRLEAEVIELTAKPVDA
jgi:hypothetical protein